MQTLFAAGNGASQSMYALFGIYSGEPGLQIFDSGSVTEKTRTSFTQDTLAFQGMLVCSVPDLQKSGNFSWKNNEDVKMVYTYAHHAKNELTNRYSFFSCRINS